jgi:hypothetical protein
LSCHAQFKNYAQWEILLLYKQQRFEAINRAQRPDISFIWGYYIISISRPQKRILDPIHIQAQKKDMDIYPISFVKFFASIVTVSEQQKARPGSTAAHKSSTFYWIKLKPRSISSAAQQGNGKSQQKWQNWQCYRKNLASETQNLGHWTLKKGYRIGYGYDILKSLKIGYYILKISCSKKR